jgi:4-methylaminobutanoate oxidase (formaldehyde-forming)
VYDRLFASPVAQEVGFRPAGLTTLGSCRLEKGYRDYGHDMDNTDTLLEVGLGFTADFTKPGGFVGDAATLAQKNGPGLRKRLVQVLCSDPEPFMHHGEVLRRNGVVVGDIRMGSYGHTLGGAIGLGHVEHPDPAGIINPAYLKDGQWTVEIADKQYPCTLSLRPMYDPNNSRIQA